MKKIISKILRDSAKKRHNIDIDEKDIEFRDTPSHVVGDVTTSSAAALAPKIGVSRENLLKEWKEDLVKKYPETRPEIIGPHFNSFNIKDIIFSEMNKIIKEEDQYFWKEKNGEKRNLEFISANPTGPLTLANGRGGFCGDVLSNVFERLGFDVEREYYLNDRGVQVLKLGHSILGNEEGEYNGEYIKELRERIKKGSPEEVGDKGVEIIVSEMIKPAIERMGIKFDRWFSEKSLYPNKIKEAKEFLDEKGLLYEKEGATWLKTSQLGDDKDRVLIKEDGEETYFMSDIAYFKDKFDRGHSKLVFFWGADHHGYIERIKSAVEALGYSKTQVDIIIMQMVKLIKDGEEFKMSKRAGVYVTLNELIDEVGIDVARFFFLMRSNNTHLNFDLDLAKDQSEKNPVYYIQYAHARICSILKDVKDFEGDISILNNEHEFGLMKELLKFNELIEGVGRDYGIQRIPEYAINLAKTFHKFYHHCQVLNEEEGIRQARIKLLVATRITLKSVLDLMGISAPNEM